MRITEQLLKRGILGLLGGACWVFVLIAVLGGVTGGDYLFAAVVGNVVGLLIADRWLRRLRGGGVFLAAELFGIGALLGWDRTPWKTDDWQGTGIVTVVLGVATVALWWAVYGYRLDPPPAPAGERGGLGEMSPRAERWAVAVLLLILALVAYYIYFVP